MLHLGSLEPPSPRLPLRQKQKLGAAPSQGETLYNAIASATSEARRVPTRVSKSMGARDFHRKYFEKRNEDFEHILTTPFLCLCTANLIQGLTLTIYGHRRCWPLKFSSKEEKNIYPWYSLLGWGKWCCPLYLKMKPVTASLFHDFQYNLKAKFFIRISWSEE